MSTDDNTTTAADKIDGETPSQQHLHQRTNQLLAEIASEIGGVSDELRDLRLHLHSLNEKLDAMDGAQPTDATQTDDNAAESDVVRIQGNATGLLKEWLEDEGVNPDKVTAANIPDDDVVQFSDDFQDMDDDETDAFRSFTNKNRIDVADWVEIGTKDNGDPKYAPDKFEVSYDTIREVCVE